MRGDVRCMLQQIPANMASSEKPPAPATLGDVLYADPTETPLAERDWVVLANLIAAGDQRALRQLYERTYRLVFSLIARITKSREAGDALTIDVFHDIWRTAPSYDPARGSVLGWVMNLARVKALERVRLEQERNADILSPTSFLWSAISKRIVTESGLLPVFTAPQDWIEPEWKEVAPGIACQLLAHDEQRDRVSMLVRLAPGTDYPPHTHAGVEELYLLHGELFIDDRKLYPGDYSCAEPGSSDSRVWRNRLHVRPGHLAERRAALTSSLLRPLSAEPGASRSRGRQLATNTLNNPYGRRLPTG
jgi:DNA-directed RNA polymerase specialized sigma24 family protein